MWKKKEKDERYKPLIKKMVKVRWLITKSHMRHDVSLRKISLYHTFSHMSFYPSTCLVNSNLLAIIYFLMLFLYVLPHTHLYTSSMTESTSSSSKHLSIDVDLPTLYISSTIVMYLVGNLINNLPLIHPRVISHFSNIWLWLTSTLMSVLSPWQVWFQLLC